LYSEIATEKESVMKIFKLVIGIISILVFGVGIALSLVNGFISDDIRITAKTISGGSAVVIAFSMMFLIAGIISIATLKSKSGGIIAGIFYLAAALIGFVSLGMYSGLKIWAVDLVIWAVISTILGIFFIIMSAIIVRLVRKQNA
jgi:hypothetical protein